VDEKERKHGNDPEKDTDNQRFLEYMKRFVVHIFSSVCVVWFFSAQPYFYPRFFEFYPREAVLGC